MMSQLRAIIVTNQSAFLQLCSFDIIYRHELHAALHRSSILGVTEGTVSYSGLIDDSVQLRALLLINQSALALQNLALALQNLALALQNLD